MKHNIADISIKINEIIFDYFSGNRKDKSLSNILKAMFITYFSQIGKNMLSSIIEKNTEKIENMIQAFFTSIYEIYIYCLNYIKTKKTLIKDIETPVIEKKEIDEQKIIDDDVFDIIIHPDGLMNIVKIINNYDVCIKEYPSIERIEWNENLRNTIDIQDETNFTREIYDLKIYVEDLVLYSDDKIVTNNDVCSTEKSIFGLMSSRRSEYLACNLYVEKNITITSEGIYKNGSDINLLNYISPNSIFSKIMKICRKYTTNEYVLKLCAVNAEALKLFIYLKNKNDFNILNSYFETYDNCPRYIIANCWNDKDTDGKILCYSDLLYYEMLNCLKKASITLNMKKNINMTTLDISTIMKKINNFAIDINKNVRKNNRTSVSTITSYFKQEKNIKNVFVCKKKINDFPEEYEDVYEDIEEIDYVFSSEITGFINTETYSLDNIILKIKQKNILTNFLNMFKNNKKDMEILGIPNKYNILLYGDPGCGKTTCIKTIASHLGKDVYYASLKNVKNNIQLKKIFDDAFSESDGIIVFEDIDAMTNVVHKRTHDSKINEDSFTLEYLINLMDGVITYDDSVIIITTNRRHLLDEALCRPGRIDGEIELTRCDHFQINTLYYKFIKRQLPQHILTKIKEDTYTPAQIKQQLINWYKNNETADEIIMEPFIS